MITYIYNHKNGNNMSEMIDVNNQRTYFYYDEANRLIRVEDESGAMLDHTQYNYQR